MKDTDHNDFEQWLHDKTRALPEPDASSEFLAAQRRSIYRRLDEPRRNVLPLRWGLSFAMLLLMALGGLTLERRHQTTTSVSTPVSDEQLFSDLDAMEQRNEPKAIQPMHGLFQE
jgi:hypothetical protein